MTITRQSTYFDNTKLAAYKACPRSYFLRHVLHWTLDFGELKTPALVFGSAWHEGMDAIWGNQGIASDEKVTLAMDAFLTSWSNDGYNPQPNFAEVEELKARTPGNAHEMFYNYVAKYERMLEDCTVLAIEQPIAVPFPNLHDTWYIGKLDKVFEWNGIHVGEHKTTTAYAIKGQFQPDWTESWGSSSQVKGYQFAGTMYYPNLRDVWVDGALVHNKVHDAFIRIPVAHAMPLLEEWLRDTRKWIIGIQMDIQEYTEQGSLESGAFQRNEDNCFGKYSKCPFLNICTTCSDPSQLLGPPPGYKVEKWEPFDELGIDRLVNK